MDVLGVVGFFTFVFSLLYIPYFFIARIKNKDKVFHKKKFLIVLISGLALFIAAMTLDDIFSISDIEEENRMLTEEVSVLNNEIDKQSSELEEIKVEIESLNEENDALHDSLEELTKEKKEIEKEKNKLEEKLKEHKKQYSALEDENKKLKEQKVTTPSTVSASTNSSGSNSNKSSGSGGSGRSGKSSSGSNKSTTQSSNKSTQSSDDVYYKNCTEAREAGVTPIYKGEPGYSKHLDRDGDGIACE